MTAASFPVRFLFEVVPNLLGLVGCFTSKGLKLSRMLARAASRRMRCSALGVLFGFLIFFGFCCPVIPCSRREAFSLLSCDGGIYLVNLSPSEFVYKKKVVEILCQDFPRSFFGYGSLQAPMPLLLRAKYAPSERTRSDGTNFYESPSHSYRAPNLEVPLAFDAPWCDSPLA